MIAIVGLIVIGLGSLLWGLRLVRAEQLKHSDQYE